MHCHLAEAAAAEGSSSSLTASVLTLPSSVPSEVALAVLLRLRTYELQVLRYARAWDCILRAVSGCPDCLMAQLMAADFFIAKSAAHETHS